MTNSWNWKLILEATVYAKGSRSGMYSLFGDALERAKELPPEIILVPRLRRQFEDEVKENSNEEFSSERYQYNKQRPSTTGMHCLKYLMLRIGLLGCSQAEWERFLAYAEKENLPLPLIGQRREDYISNLLAQIFPKCSTMQLRTSDAFWLPVSAPIAMVPFDGSQYENRDSCCYLLNPSHLENHSFKGQIPFDDLFCGQDLTKVYVSDDPSGQGNEINLRYKNLLGSPSNGEEEFQAGKQLKVFFQNSLSGALYFAHGAEEIRYSLEQSCDILEPIFQTHEKVQLTQYPWFEAMLQEETSLFSWAQQYTEEIAQSARLRYTYHPPKLFLDQIDLAYDSNILTLTFSHNGYLEQRVLRKYLDKLRKKWKVKSPLEEEEEHFLSLWKNSLAEDYHGFSQQKPEEKLWANVGGGCWVITKDGYLVLSYRGNRVGEIPGIFSYSASGSYDYFSHDGSTQTPQDAMAKELKEELGILETNTADAIRLIALGIDTERYLLQFSYLWECPYTAQELNMRKVNFASRQGKSEQVTLFAPLHRELHRDYLKLLKTVRFEPGAAFSLSLLLQKKFGWPFQR